MDLRSLSESDLLGLSESDLLALLESGPDESIQPVAGSVALAGLSPTVSRSGVPRIEVAPNAGSMATSGSAPILSETANVYIRTGVGSIALSGKTPKLTVPSPVIIPDTGRIDVSGFLPRFRSPISAAQFTEWVMARMPSTVILVELDYHYQSGSGSSATMKTGTIGFGTKPFRSDGSDIPASLTYPDRISDLPTFTRRIGDALMGRFAPSYGDLKLTNVSGELNFLFGMLQDGCDARFYIGDEVWPRQDFVHLFTATWGQPTADSPNSITIPMRSRDALLDAGVVGAAISGSGSNAGKPMPTVWGRPRNMTPLVEVDSTLKYRWCGNRNSGAVIEYVRDNGSALTHYQAGFTEDSFWSSSPSGDTIGPGLGWSAGVVIAVDDVLTLYNAGGGMPAPLVDGGQYWVIAIIGGGYKVSATKGGAAIDITEEKIGSFNCYRVARYYDNSDGTITLSGTPNGRITMDPYNPTPTGGQYVSDVFYDLFVNFAAQSSANWAGAHGSYSGLDPAIGYVVNDRENMLDIMDKLAFSACAFYGFDRKNRFAFGHVRPDSIPSLTSKATLTRRNIRPASLRRRVLPLGYKTTRPIYAKNWTQQDSLSAALAVYSADYYRGVGQQTASTASATPADYMSSPWLYHPTMIDGPIEETLISGNSGPYPDASWGYVYGGITDATTWTSRRRSMMFPWVEIIDVETIDLRTYDVDLGDVVTTDFDDIAGLSAEYDPITKFGLSGQIRWQVIAVGTALQQRDVQFSLVRRRVPDYSTVY